MSNETPTSRSPLAIVGIGALFPGSSELRGFWRDILAGRDLIGEVPPHYWLVEDFYDPDPLVQDKTYCKRGAFLSKVDFDPIAFGIPPANLASTDTSQLLALMVAKQVLEDAATSFGRVNRERISVILGVAAGLELVGEMAGRLQRPIWQKSLREHGLPEHEVHEICDRIAAHSVPWTESTFPGLLGNVVTGRIANRFDLGGTNCTTDAACASSFSALAMAANELYLGDSDLVITGGVDTTNDPFLFLCFSKTPALSLSGDCRPFSAEADGTMLGEGLGMVALRRLEDAERDGDRIYAVIHGIGTSSDGRAKSVYAPRPEGQARALQKAYRTAGYGPETVELLEAHGTGTMAGDVAEFEGLSLVFDEAGREDRPWCALGSIKSQLGHTKAAAGVAGLIKVALALRHKVLPPTIKVARPDPRLKIEKSPFYLNTRSRPWISRGTHPRRGSVSSFGFGGTNFHVTLEEYRGPTMPRLRTMPSELVLLGAASPTELAVRCRAMAADVQEGGEGMLLYLAHACQQAPLEGRTRLALVATDERDLGAKLLQAAEHAERERNRPLSLPTGLHYVPAVDNAPGPGVALLFSGQGSQYLEMGADLAMHFDVARLVWDRFGAVELGGTRLHEVVWPHPVFSDEAREAQQRRLTATEWAQPALGATSLATLAILRAVGLEPCCLGGHSFGELTALCAAGVLAEEDFLQMARRRGELMAEASRETPGAMIAVVHAADALRELLDQAGIDVALANINSPRQVVLSGATVEVERAERLLGERKIQTRRLPVSTAFHSKVVEHAVGPFAAFLEQIPFGPARLPVYANSEAAPYPEGAAAMRALLAQQIARPVRFAEEIEAMWSAGASIFVEVGPGSVLTGLVDQCLADRPHLALSTDRKGQHGVTVLHNALGQLVACGLQLDLAPLWADVAPAADPRQRVRPKLVVPIDGVNHGKRYPSADGKPALPPPAAPKKKAAAPPATHVPSSPTLPSPATKQNTAVSVQGRRPAVNELPMSQPSSKGPGAGSWLEAFQEIQRQTAEAHAAYQRAMADSHIAFLRTAEAASQHLHAVLTGQPVPQPQPRTIEQPLEAPTWPATEVVPAPTLPPVVEQAASVSAPSDVAPAVAAPEAESEPGGLEVVDFQELLLEVVAEKTGYPREILAMEMGLEADLGIDSIKRVEILSTLKDRMPGLPEVDPSQIPNLQTLGQVLAFIEQHGGGNGDGGVDATGGNGKGRPAAQSLQPATIERAVVREVPAPADGSSLLAGLGPKATVAVVEGGPLGPALAARLRERGLEAVATADTDREVEQAEAVIYCGGLIEPAGAEEAVAVSRRAFGLARRVAAGFGERGGAFVTVQDTGGDFGLSGRAGERCWLCGLAGLAKTAALEWPRTAVRAIDLERGGRSADELAGALEQELFGGGTELEVGLHADGTRTTLTCEPAAASNGATVVDRGSVLVVSGGGRGVTTATLLELARRCQPTLVLLGRTPLEEEPAACRSAGDEASLMRVLLDQAQAEGRAVPPAELSAQVGRILAVREIRATVAELEQAGARARYVTVDVRDGEAVSRVLGQVREELGPITGLIHAAGVLADKTIAEKTPEQFDRVFDTKVLGLRNLLAGTADDPLALICLFSSVAGRFGNAGQADYAMANEILNRVAAAEALRREGACLVRTIGWGPWEGGMVTPALQSYFRSLGVPLIPLELGARMLLDELGEGGAVEVLIGGLPVGGRPQARTAASQREGAAALP